MSKVTNYLIIMTGLIILLTFAGIQTGPHIILERIGILDSPQNIESSSFFTAILAALAIAAGGMIVIGFYWKSSPKDILLAELVIYLLYFVSEFVGIIVYANAVYGEGSWSFVSYVVMLIFGSLTVGYLMSVMDWYNGGS